MPILATATNPAKRKADSQPAAETACVTSIHARLVSLDGGIILAICLLLTAFFAGAMMAGTLELAQRLLFGLLMLGAWVYLLDSVTERVALIEGALVRTSFLQRQTQIPVADMRQLVLVHEGLNQAVGIESLIIRYQNGKEETLSLGPCWRQRDLQAFVRSVDQVMKFGA